MSRQSATMSISMKKRHATPACKHCENLKLPSSHWLRSLGGGEIVCPVLLATECRYCHLTGHTVKACPELALKNKVTPAVREKQREKIEPNKVFVPVKSGFGVLQEDTDSEEDEHVARIYPEEIWNGKPSFAKVLSTPPPYHPVKLSLVHPDTIEMNACVAYPRSPVDSPPPDSRLFTPFANCLDKYKGMSWADICDSDDDEDF